MPIRGFFSKTPKPATPQAPGPELGKTSRPAAPPKGTVGVPGLKVRGKYPGHPLPFPALLDGVRTSPFAGRLLRTALASGYLTNGYYCTRLQPHEAAVVRDLVAHNPLWEAEEPFRLTDYFPKTLAGPVVSARWLDRGHPPRFLLEGGGRREVVARPWLLTLLARHRGCSWWFGTGEGPWEEKVSGKPGRPPLVVLEGGFRTGQVAAALAPFLEEVRGTGEPGGDAWKLVAGEFRYAHV